MDTLKRSFNCQECPRSYSCKQSLSRHTIVEHNHYRAPGKNLQVETVNSYKNWSKRPRCDNQDLPASYAIEDKPDIYYPNRHPHHRNATAYTVISEHIPARVPTRPEKVHSTTPRLMKSSRCSANQAFQMTRATAERVTNNVALAPDELLKYVKEEPLLPATTLAEKIGVQHRWDQGTVRRHAQRIQDQRAARYDLLRKLRGEFKN